MWKCICRKHRPSGEINGCIAIEPLDVPGILEVIDSIKEPGSGCIQELEEEPAALSSPGQNFGVCILDVVNSLESPEWPNCDRITLHAEESKKVCIGRSSLGLWLTCCGPCVLTCTHLCDEAQSIKQLLRF